MRFAQTPGGSFAIGAVAGVALVLAFMFVGRRLA